MGHLNFGTLPVTRTWKGVVGLIEARADTATIAERTLEAAQIALATVGDDPGFREASHLMVQLAVAGTKGDPLAHLSSMGVEFGESGSIAEVATAISKAVDQRMTGKGQRSDWGEISRNSLVAAMTHYLAADGGASLFSKTREDLAASLRKLKNPDEFSRFGQKFMGTLTNKFLNYFLTKKIGGQVGVGKPFPSLNTLGQFKAAMNLHCEETAGRTREYFSGWLEKQYRKKEATITRQAAEQMMWYGVDKIRRELGTRAK